MYDADGKELKPGDYVYSFEYAQPGVVGRCYIDSAQIALDDLDLTVTLRGRDLARRCDRPKAA